MTAAEILEEQLLICLAAVFAKLANYTGRSLNNLVASTEDQSERFVFRLHGNRVYYMPLKLANLAVSIPRGNLLSVGTMIGKFTKTGKFRLNITCLSIIAPYARYKLWVKPNGEMPFLYGGNVVKAHIGRWSEDCPEHSGVVVYSMVSWASTGEKKNFADFHVFRMTPH